MGSCCDNKEDELASTAQRHRRILWVVLVINLVMFFVESISGHMANSLALVGDSLDMLGDGRSTDGLKNEQGNDPVRA